METNDLIPNGLRTNQQSVTGAGATLDLSFLSPTDNVISITITPEAVGKLAIEGIAGDTALEIPAEGNSYFIAFRPNKTTLLPYLKTLDGDTTANIEVAIKGW